MMDRRSERNLIGVSDDLVVIAQRAFALFSDEVTRLPRSRLVITDGVRTKEQQEINVAAGRSWTLESKHLTGDAIDFAVISSGVAVHLDGGDASVIGIESIDAINGGYGLMSASLYGPNVGRLTAQACAVSLAVGKSPSSSHVGGTIGALYSELNTFDIAKVTALNAGMSIGPVYGTTLSKITHCGIARLTNNAFNISEGAPPFLGMSLELNGTKLESRALMRPGQLKNSSTSMPIGGHPLRRSYSTDTLTINLTWDADQHQITGYDYDELLVFGTASGAAPAGTLTFAAAGSTVNGGTGGAFSGLTGPAKFLVIYDISRDVFEVVNTTA